MAGMLAPEFSWNYFLSRDFYLSFHLQLIKGFFTFHLEIYVWVPSQWIYKSSDTAQSFPLE